MSQTAVFARVTRVVLESVREEFAAMESHLGLYPAIARLPERQFDVTVLRYVLEYPTDETARIMGVTETTVRCHHAAARRKIALHLKRGDTRDARHWAGQAANLEHEADHRNRRKQTKRQQTQHTQIPETILLLRALHGLLTDEVCDIAAEDFYACTGTLPTSLTRAVRRLEPDSTYTPMPWPDLALADELHETMPCY
ncbi:sigma-70 family RNA polymerase sigma factor [Wenjunlia tyrosinilytica]|uniref:RNA polymerase sigma factor 70 region 4 type 2 domain-containing protein n=1 Tax=Wenjunlia tyrosinilytica TaxID=1544741 RepID=A0A917ZX53_9ACTN|nr:sigma-70 family RNA polymerase sigma factor [Wenjunlia tyrosinilytica]GGP00045.1 hypothetical protein GCM10012280_67880 [Wenjunlia tyrosinilytica]